MAKTCRANLIWKGGCVGLKSDICVWASKIVWDFWQTGLELKAIETARILCKPQISNSNSLIQKTSVLNAYKEKAKSDSGWKERTADNLFGSKWTWKISTLDSGFTRSMRVLRADELQHSWSRLFHVPVWFHNLLLHLHYFTIESKRQEISM